MSLQVTVCAGWEQEQRASARRKHLHTASSWGDERLQELRPALVCPIRWVALGRALSHRWAPLRLFWKGSPHSNIRHEGRGNTRLTLSEKRKSGKKTNHRRRPLTSKRLPLAQEMCSERLAGWHRVDLTQRCVAYKRNCTRAFWVQRSSSGSSSLPIGDPASVADRACPAEEPADQSICGFCCCCCCFSLGRLILNTFQHYWCLSNVWYQTGCSPLLINLLKVTRLSERPSLNSNMTSVLHILHTL